MSSMIVVIDDGVSRPVALSVCDEESRRRLAFFYLLTGEKSNLLADWVRRVVNILNKHTILSDCLEPPDHC